MNKNCDTELALASITDVPLVTPPYHDYRPGNGYGSSCGSSCGDGTGYGGGWGLGAGYGGSSGDLSNPEVRGRYCYSAPPGLFQHHSGNSMSGVTPLASASIGRCT